MRETAETAIIGWYTLSISNIRMHSTDYIVRLLCQLPPTLNSTVLELHVLTYVYVYTTFATNIVHNSVWFMSRRVSLLPGQYYIHNLCALSVIFIYTNCAINNLGINKIQITIIKIVVDIVWWFIFFFSMQTLMIDLYRKLFIYINIVFYFFLFKSTWKFQINCTWYMKKISSGSLVFIWWWG